MGEAVAYAARQTSTAVQSGNEERDDKEQEERDVNPNLN